MKCWGLDSNGQLGDNARASSKVPVAVMNIAGGAQTIAIGAAHSCAVVDGALVCWGANPDGELGNSSTTDSGVPIAVTGFIHGIQAIALGAAHTCAGVDTGVQCWGENLNTQLGNTSVGNGSNLPVHANGLAHGVTSLAAGDSHTCAVVDGHVLCWGMGTYGELGDGSNEDNQVAAQVTGLVSGAQSVVTGARHTCALVNGGVWCWGDDQYGQLGNGDTSRTSSNVPLAVTGLTHGVQALAAGSLSYHTCALVDGGVQCWGDAVNGEVGTTQSLPQLTPFAVPGLSHGVQAITANGAHTCARTNGAVVCWGDDFYGDLGDNSTMGASGKMGAQTDRADRCPGYSFKMAGDGSECGRRAQDRGRRR